MNKYKKFALYATIIILLIIAVVQYFKIDSRDKTISNQAVELLIKDDSAKILKDKNGKLYYQLKSVLVESGNVKQALETAGYTIKELRQKNIKYKDLVGILTAKIESAGSGSTIGFDTTFVANNETVHGKKYKDWNNGNLFLYGMYSDKDSLYHKYKYQTGITLFPERSGKKTKVTATLTDTHATITTGYSILIENKTPWFKKWYVWGGAGLLGGYFITK